jgi:hypothetical protein
MQMQGKGDVIEAVPFQVRIGRCKKRRPGLILMFSSEKMKGEWGYIWKVQLNPMGFEFQVLKYAQDK